MFSRHDHVSNKRRICPIELYVCVVSNYREQSYNLDACNAQDMKEQAESAHVERIKGSNKS